jgi:diguanylate cyclase (GGDEF)-like protein
MRLNFYLFTVSIGISHRVEETLSFEALMKSADHALYRAKALGRNRTARAQV